VLVYADDPAVTRRPSPRPSGVGYYHDQQIQRGEVIVARRCRQQPPGQRQTQWQNRRGWATTMRDTIDFGIDLGTTNCAIAVAGTTTYGS